MRRVLLPLLLVLAVLGVTPALLPSPIMAQTVPLQAPLLVTPPPPSSTTGNTQPDPLQASTKTVNVELILDASGSMAEALPEGETRMAAAKRILREVIAGLPERAGVNVGLRVYGHLGDNTEASKALSCGASELLVPVSGLDKAALIAHIEAIQPTGWTPIAFSLEQAAADFQPGGESITNAVVLVTDGEETCNPAEQSCTAAASLHQSNVTVTTHVVGFALTPQQTELVRCVAEEGGGQLFGANNAVELSTALSAALEDVGVAPPAVHAQVPPAAAPVPLVDVRTLGYHQISAWTVGVADGGESAPILSDDGQRIAFTRPIPGTQDPANLNRIVLVNADGSDEREVDAYTPKCACVSLIDLNADGSRIVSTDAVQLRIADGTAGSGRELLALDSNEINAVRISGDGTTIVFRLRRGANIVSGASAQLLPAGISAINADGSGLRHLAGPAQLAPLFGVPPEQFPAFDGSTWGLDVSSNGGRIVFQTQIPEVDPPTGSALQALYAVNGDGSGLHALIPSASTVRNGAISGDGATVASYTTDWATGLAQAGVMSFDGGPVRPLTDSLTGGWLPADGDRMGLSFDGTRLLLGSNGLLVDTASGAMLILGMGAVGGAIVTGDPPQLVGDGLFRATMSADAGRMAFLSGDATGIRQLATADINPANLGAAPSVTEARVDPAFVLTEGRSAATVSARVSTPNPFVRVTVRTLRDGLPDGTVDASYRGPLIDDGVTNGDAVAADSVFTTDQLLAQATAELGPRIVRIKAETQAADGLRHATAVDVVPFAVVMDAAEIPQGPTVTPTLIPTVTPTTTPTMTPTATPTVTPTLIPTVTVTPTTVIPVPATPLDFCGTTFPGGAISFADAVLAYTPVLTAEGNPIEAHRDPQRALGQPDYDPATDTGHVTLGSGGSIALQFLDNAVVPNGGAEPDLWICEIGPDVEATYVEVSRDGTNWTPVGRVGGGVSGIDLDALLLAPTERFNFVRLTDDPNEGGTGGIDPGADIDAVGAVSTIPDTVTPVPMQPTVIVTPVTPVSTNTENPQPDIPNTEDTTVTVTPVTVTPVTVTPVTVTPVTPQSGGSDVTPVTVVPPDSGMDGGTSTGTGEECSCEELTAAQATVAALSTRVAELEGGNPPASADPVTPAEASAAGESAAGTGAETGTSQEPAPVGDLTTPDPAECTSAPRSAVELEALWASTERMAAFPQAALAPGLEIPAGDPADAATVGAVEGLYRQMMACLNAGNELAAATLWTDPALLQAGIHSSSTSAPTPIPEAERSSVQVREVRIVPDGRVVAVWEERAGASLWTTVQVVERQGDRLLIGEILDLDRSDS